MRTVFIFLGLVAAALAAPLADVQETGSLADTPPPYFANTQQYDLPMWHGGTGEGTILTDVYNVNNSIFFWRCRQTG